MPLESSLKRVESIYDTLTTADVVDNTFGATQQVSKHLSQISLILSHDPAALTDDFRSRLQQLLTNLEDNPSIFAIPEMYLIHNVYKHVSHLRKIVGT